MLLSAALQGGRRVVVASNGGSSLIKNVASRQLATIRKTACQPIAQHILENLPDMELEEGPYPKPDPPTEPLLYKRHKVTSCHMIDKEKEEVSALDSAAIGPSGSIVHGRYGDLGDAAAAVPLEYLALLRPAAEGARAVRTIAGAADSSGKKGTMIVYGATEANGLAAVQMGAAEGHAVVAVVGTEHSQHEEMKDCIKGLAKEPGVMVPETFALNKKHFLDMVHSVSSGDDGTNVPSTAPDEYLAEFKELFMMYTAAFPEQYPAAMDPERFKFLGMEKDRESFRINMEEYLAQYNPGSPPMERAVLEQNFTKEQYQIFREKFWKQTSDIISGDRRLFFSPPHIVKELCEEPEIYDNPDTREFPYSFSVLDEHKQDAAPATSGGPVLGAVICVTPDLKIAAEAVDKEPTLRGKAEALQFLTSCQRTVFGAACSVAAVAKKHGAPVYVMGGSLPGLESLGEPTEEDVKDALSAMDIDDDGNSKLNYFVHVYRACDFPFWGQYAVHKATEVMFGPRQVIVAK